MLRAFIDESYCDDWFYMVAAIADDGGCVRMTAEMNDLMADVSYGFPIEAGAEVHGYDLLQGRGIWNGSPLPSRISVAARVLTVIADNDVKFIIRGIDRKAQTARYKKDVYDPYPIVLTHLMQEINVYAASHAETVRVTCDEIHEHDRHRAMLERHRATGTPTYKRTKLAYIVEQLEFVTSDSSRMVQAADIVAYLKHRIVSKPEAPGKETRTRRQLWRIVEPKIQHDKVWVP